MLKKMDKNHRWHFSVFLQDTVIIKISILVDQVVIFTSFIMSIIFGISFLEQTVILVEINKKMRFDKTVFCRLPPEGITFFTHLSTAFIFRLTSTTRVSLLAPIVTALYGNVIFAASISCSTPDSSRISLTTFPFSLTTSFDLFPVAT